MPIRRGGMETRLAGGASTFYKRSIYTNFNLVARIIPKYIQNFSCKTSYGILILGMFEKYFESRSNMASSGNEAVLLACTACREFG